MSYYWWYDVPERPVLWTWERMQQMTVVLWQRPR